MESKGDSKENKKRVESIEEKITEQLLANQRKEFEKELKDLKDIQKKKGKSAAIFNLKEKVIGQKKAGQEATIMKDPKTKDILTSRTKIKEASLDYCVELLTNRSPKEEYKKEIEIKDEIHTIRMEEQIENDVEFTEKIFFDSINELKKKNKKKYEFIIQSGKSFKDALFKLFDLVWRSEEKPEQWRRTVIIQLYKGKGEKNEFGNQRNIHTKLDIPKLFGHTVMSQAKETTMNSLSKFQIGTKTGHRAQEHLFTLKSIISLYLMLDLPMLVLLYDIAKFFYRESLRDGMDAIYNCGIKGKLYGLFFNMNKDTRIRVKTPVGETEEKESGENIGQGTLEGALISAANIDYSINKFFKNSKEELSYGGIYLQPLMFQDDMSRMSTSVHAAQAGNKIIE